MSDSQGGLHVVSGSHNASFMYTHTATPAEPTTWSKPAPMLLDGYRIAGKAPRGRQTYVSLVCTPADRLVVVFRQWRRGVDADFHGQAYEALCAQWLDPGGSWTRAQRIALCSRNGGYAQYYQKMSIDRLGRIFLSLSYFRPHDWPVEERAANRYHHRMILDVGGRRGDLAVRHPGGLHRRRDSAAVRRGGGGPPGGPGPRLSSAAVDVRAAVVQRRDLGAHVGEAAQVEVGHADPHALVPPREHLAPRVDDQAVAEAVAPRQVLAHLVRRDDEAAVLDGAGAQEHLPVGRARVRGERGRHAQDLRSAQRQRRCRGSGKRRS